MHIIRGVLVEVRVSNDSQDPTVNLIMQLNRYDYTLRKHVPAGESIMISTEHKKILPDLHKAVGKEVDIECVVGVSRKNTVYYRTAGSCLVL